MSEPVFFYRLFNDVFYEGKAMIHMEQFPVVKKTACGVWLDEGGKRKFVLLKNWAGNPTVKRWACPTKQEAIASFIARKQRQVERAESTTRSAKAALAAATEPGFDPGEPLTIYQPFEFDSTW